MKSMIGKSFFGLLFACLFSCAGYKEIAPASPEFHELKIGDVIWVHTGVVSRDRVVFIHFSGDSLFTDRYVFHIDSITRIQKEYKSTGNSSVLIGGFTVIGTMVVVSAVASALAVWALFFKIFSIF